MPFEQGKLIVCQSKDGHAAVDVQLRDDTAWLSSHQMAILFGRYKPLISRHLRNIFQSGELGRNAVVAKNATTAADENKRIGSFLFLLFLSSNGSAADRIPDNKALVSLTLLTATSDPADNDIIIRLIINLLADDKDH